MSKAIIRAQDVGVRFGRSDVWAVRHASLEVGSDQTLGIVGESGSGKTTIARVLAGALPPTTGTVSIEGRAWSEVSRSDAQRRHVQMVFQDPIGSLNPRLSARDTVGEVFRVWDRVDRDTAGNLAADLLRRVGLEGPVIDRRPRGMSGGQCQRVGIARALACRPRVLIADEPTSSLDVSVQAQILNLLADIRAEQDMAIVLVSHDLSVIRHMTDQVVVMYHGEIVERGLTRELFSTPQHPYTQLLVDASSRSRRQTPSANHEHEIQGAESVSYSRTAQ